jgi:peptidoglycan/LPS O-acetylase OafA/YrhL
MEARAETASPDVAPANPSVRLHLAHVEGLRALAAYVVYINHAYAQVWVDGEMVAPPKAFSPFSYSMIAGHLAVTVFIVISGFCLTLPVVSAGGELRGGTMAFLRRRARRILPPYYGAVALCMLLIWTIIGRRTGTLWDVPISVKDHFAVGVLSHVFLVQDLFGTSEINYVFWSIAVEWQIYLLFPTLVSCWRRRGAAVTVASALVVGYAVRFAFRDTRIARAAPHYLGLFALGMMAAYVVRGSGVGYARMRERVPWGWLSGLSFLAASVVVGRWGWEPAPGLVSLLDLPVAIGTMALLVLTSCVGRPSVVTNALSWKPLVFIGTFSYSVYLIHAPLLQILWQYVLRPAHVGRSAMFVALMIPGALVVLAASNLFFRILEEPFMGQSGRKAALRSQSLAQKVAT